MDLFTLFKYMDLYAQIEIYDRDCNFIERGIRGTIDLPEKLLDQPVYKFIPGIVTMIYLDIILT
jgi:hypothetical protein